MEKNKKIALLLGGLAVVAILTISLFIFFKPNDKEQEKTLTKEEIEKAEMEEIEEHTHHAYEFGEDPFVNEEDEEERNPDEALKVDGLSFVGPYALENATVQDNSSMLLRATEHYLIFRGFEDYVYVYDLETKKIYPITEKAGQIAISEDEKHLFYTQEENNMEAIFYYDLVAKGYRGQVATTPYFHKIDQIAYKDTLLYFTYHEASDPSYHFTNVSVFKNTSTSNKYVLPKEGNVYFDTSVGGGFIGNDYYTYNASTNALAWVQPTNASLVPREKLSFTVAKGELITQIDYNDKKEYVLRSSSDDNTTGHVYLKDGQIPNFDNVLSAYWLDNEHLLILNANVVHLYNTTTKKAVDFKTDVKDMHVNGDHIYITNEEDQTAYVITKK